MTHDAGAHAGPAGPAGSGRPVRNLVPLPYRRVSYQKADFPLTDAGLATIIGREAYRYTDFVVYHAGDATAVAEVVKASQEPLFSPIISAEWLSTPGRTRFVIDHDVDPGLPSSLAAKAEELGISSEETLVVLGRYEHVNFISRPQPLVLTILEVAPPDPPKLIDLARRVLESAPLPAMKLELERVDLRDLAGEPGPDGYLLPCRSSGFEALGAPVHFLDERPDRADWVLVGCERSRQIHEHHYGDVPPTREICPRILAGQRTTPTLVKCCMFESGVIRDGQVVVVPWGADLRNVEAGLRELEKLE